ncbi:hypothetical protein HYALB_00001005 [Hymenoscyphus albidus]|uniref:Uncharacterized protein n=1 Tax=Hymenoscyphus albidus TaxID=595503 RepID=A0A9N9QC32_9HELO|nr:hypothetical protein HYALB_00001005 [Hymenoscyphus albidus]
MWAMQVSKDQGNLRDKIFVVLRDTEIHQCDLGYHCGQCVRGQWNCTREVPKLKNINAFGMGRFKLSTGTSKIRPEFDFTSDPKRAILAVTPHLSEALDSRALCYFRASFVVGQLRSFVYLEDFYQNGRDMSDCLSLSIQSVGIACLARNSHSQELEAVARKTYASALQSLNKSLSSHKLTKQDSTLSSVMVLNHFEGLLPSKNSTTQALSSHLQGASALLKIRGPEHFRSRIGLDLFAHFTSYITLICAQHELPIPAEYLEQET